MKTNRKTIIIALSTLAIGLLLGWLIFGGSSESKTDEEHQHTTEVAGETVWTCSMHPQIRQSEPGDCPICGMDLIPLDNEQDEQLDPMAISMSPTAMQLANVSTAVVGTMNPVKMVRLNGKVQADERLVYSQSSHIPGRIEKLTVNFTGEFVRKGQTIAAVYSPDLVTAQEELFEAQKIKETQPQLFSAAREKLKNWKLSNSQIDEIIQRGSIKEEFAITADVSGYVTEKKVNLGDYVRKGEAIYEVADLSKVWLLFDVYESDMSWINKGDKVSFTIASFPGETFSGKVSYLDPVIDPKTRVAKARVEISNAGQRLKPEMFASGTVEATLPAKSDKLVVPKTAVMWTGKRSVVYVKSTSGKGVSFLMRDVTLGAALGESFIVENGLQEGDEIAVNGTFSIDAAAQLAGKPSMMRPEGGVAMTGHSNHGGTGAPESATQSDHATHQGKPKEVAISDQAKTALRPVYMAYMAMKDALSLDNLAAAQKASADISKSLSAINMSLFPGESHDVWMKYSSDMGNALQHIPHQKSLDEVRKSFQQVSDILIAMSQAFNPMDEPLYVDFCPMADNNRGASWLSLSEEIKNPYFGEAMLSCGEVKSIIK
ncbi:efflux RND transporter periplasmic adaptor subunit [Imperialibacter roseus]|uniref:Efflux RND transporter periplasmic adaptor subunit n=1 Tax=Imperialibacter roseus TaxID=1324217 RepID=A0ABZ0IUH4_9BACT|nr:efflux RND transporter periplasmic adaptor subunit [Imperialibacter roseus]WOK07267.1 efflux RND transporter periplasmic adaptor subunit [Imperialibacter roseus]